MICVGDRCDLMITEFVLVKRITGPTLEVIVFGTVDQRLTSQSD